MQTVLVLVHFADSSSGKFRLLEEDLTLGSHCFNWFWKIAEMSEDKKEIWLEDGTK